MYSPLLPGRIGAALSRRRLLVVAALALSSACAPPKSHIVDLWSDPTVSRDPMHRLVVVAVKQDPIRRRQWEDALAAELQSRHVQAVPSYQISPNSIPDSTTMADRLSREHFDGVVMVKQSGQEERKNYVPPTSYIGRAGVVYNPFWGTYRTVYREYVTPGYVENEHLLWYRTTVYDLRRDAQEVWTAATQTVNPDSPTAVRDEVSGLIVPAMAKSGII
jgi:hypothetical protein